MTNFEKVMKNQNSHSLAFLLYKSGACPFPQVPCWDCDLYNENLENLDNNTYCNCPKDMESIIKWLEMECD